MHISWNRFSFVLSSALMLASCGNDSPAPDQGPDAATAQNDAVAGPTEAELAGVVLAVNEGAVEHGDLGRMKATNPAVRQFAERLVSEHTAAGQEATAAFDRLAIEPAKGSASDRIEESSDELLDTLRALMGADFDRAFIDTEISRDTQVLQALDQNPVRPELAELVVHIREKLTARVADARQLRQML